MADQPDRAAYLAGDDADRPRAHQLGLALVPDYATQTSVLSTSMVFAGIAGWAVGAGIFVLMACAVVVFRLGFAATNSIQQLRLGRQTQKEAPFLTAKAVG